MEFRIHMDNVAEVEERGKEVKLVLKNGVVMEDCVKNFGFDDPWIYHFDKGRR